MKMKIKMKYVKSYSQLNEKINMKNAIVGGVLATGLLGGVGGYIHDKSIEPTEINQSSHVDIPNSFKMKKKLLSVGGFMYITNDNKENFGKIEEKIFNLTARFDYKDNTGKLIAHAEEQFLSLLNVINIYDENDNLIGSVEEQLFGSLLPNVTVYSIKDKNGKTIAKSEKTDLFTTDIEIIGDGVIKIHKELLSLGDWDVSIDNSKIDKRLVIFIPSFISSKDEKNKDDK